MSADREMTLAGGTTAEREMTFEDVLRYVGMYQLEVAAHDGAGKAGNGCASGACGCGTAHAPAASQPRTQMPGAGSSGCGCGGPRNGAAAAQNAEPRNCGAPAAPAGGNTIFEKPVDRRNALRMLFGVAAAGAQVASACSPIGGTDEEREAKLLEWEEHFKGNFALMTDKEKAETIARLERLAKLRKGVDVSIDTTDALPGVEYGYAFNISKCKGYRNCVDACVQENNLDRKAGTQYIRIFEMENGEVDFDHADATYQHEVPAEGHFYIGTQCFQCANPPCVAVCPVRATWQEPDGIVVVDYDWCIGCRYCVAACPYWARRFNWAAPEVPAEQLNPNQHYLGNRMRKKGVVEKCTFCIQRTRQGRLPACAEACPTGARVFGNLLDPNSEIRWVLENKRVFRLKEDLKTEPRFWYFMD
jgi:molybdopterin-containing oxidoreductase family iron-sulfur binding subunit